MDIRIAWNFLWTIWTHYLGFVGSKWHDADSLSCIIKKSWNFALAIIRLHPYYKPRSFFNRQTTSPLYLALDRKMSTNSRILIDNFPELVDFQNQTNKYTSIHLAVYYEQQNLLKLLLKLAKAETITATTGFWRVCTWQLGCNNWPISIRLYWILVFLLLWNGIIWGNSSYDFKKFNPKTF